MPIIRNFFFFILYRFDFTVFLILSMLTSYMLRWYRYFLLLFSKYCNNTNFAIAAYLT